MPETTHSISFSTPNLPHDEVLSRCWACIKSAGAKGGGTYTLQWIGSEDDTQIVAQRKELPRDALPNISEHPSTYNYASFSAWIDTHEFALTFFSTTTTIEYDLVFVSNAVRSPGPAWLTRLMGDLAVALSIDCTALLTCGDEERDTEERRKKGEPLVDIVQERALGKSDLGFPKLALLHHEATDPELWEAARNAGHRIGIIRKDWIMISSVHE